MHKALAELLKQLKLTLAADAPAVKAGISGSLAAALEEIARRPGIGVAAAAESLGITTASASALISKLSDQGYVVKQRAQDDRRAVALYVTNKGKAMAERIRTFRFSFAQKLLAGLGEEERLEFIRLFAKALDSLPHEQEGENAS